MCIWKHMRLFPIIFVLILFGCASYPQNKLPTVATLPDMSDMEDKPSAYIDVSFRTNISNATAAQIDLGRKTIINTVDRVTREIELFETYTFHKTESFGKDYTIMIDMLNHGDESAAFCAGFIAGLSFWTIPVWCTDNYTMTARVFDVTGKSLGEYQFSDSMKTYFHLFLIFTRQNTPKNSSEILLTNMIRNLYKQLYDDKILKFGNQLYVNNNKEKTRDHPLN